MNSLHEHSPLLAIVWLGLTLAAAGTVISATGAEGKHGGDVIAMTPAEYKQYPEYHLNGAGVSQQSGQGGAGQDMWNQMSGGLADFISGKKGEPLSLGGQGGIASALSMPTAISKEEEKKEEKKELKFDLKNMREWVKLIFNPMELVRTICVHFNLPMDKFIDKLGKQMVVGVEAMMQPFMSSIKIVEKVFKADHCRLKFICHMGSRLDFARDHVLRFTPTFLEHSHHIKALSDGIIGRDCEIAFPNCEPKLKKPYEELKYDNGSVQQLLELGGGGGKGQKQQDKLLA